MTDSGLEKIKLAKETGTWEALINVQNSVIPEDLQRKLNKNKTAIRELQCVSTVIKAHYPGVDLQRKKIRDPKKTHRGNRVTCSKEYKGKSL